MPRIIPAILENTIEGFENKLSLLFKIPEINRIHVDISDGVFVENKTFDLSDLDILNPAFEWEAHLMVKNPKDYFLDLKIAGFNFVVIHYEAVDDKSTLEKLAVELSDLHLFPILALNPDTSIDDVVPFVKSFSQILLMDIEPGRQGMPFLESTYERVEKLKNTNKDLIIEVDGGIKSDNAKRLIDAGADFLVVGSGLFEIDPESEAPLEEGVVQNYQRIAKEILNS
jgi:ribulose-phosphate 3-epimerase